MLNQQQLQKRTKFYMNHLKEQVGKDIKIITKEVDLSNPANPKVNNVSYDFKCILERDEDAYANTSVDNMEYKVCSILIEDIENVNEENDANIPTPPKSMKKQEGLEISVDNGSNYSIREENLDGFGLFYRLRIEREY